MTSRKWRLAVGISACVMVGAVLAVTGVNCAGQGTRPPSPTPAVHAALPSYEPFYGKVHAEGGDTVLTARFRSGEKFGQQKKGNWVCSWYVETFDVVTVERGSWSDPTVSFVCKDYWPAVESGIMLKKLPWPYQTGLKIRFWLDTKQHPALILGQEPLDNS